MGYFLRNNDNSTLNTTLNISSHIRCLSLTLNVKAIQR